MNQQEIYNFPEAAGTIVDKIRSKGWNAYDSTGVRTDTEGTAALARGPALTLKIDRRYVMMPICDEPNNPLKINQELERVAIALNRQCPEIIIAYERFPWTGFIPKDNFVKVNTICGHQLDYREFVSALDSIFDANKSA